MATGNERIHLGLIKVSTGEIIRCSRVKFNPDFEFLKLYILGFATEGYNADNIEIIEFDSNEEVLYYSKSMGTWADNDYDPITKTSKNLPRETDSKYLNGLRKTFMKRNRASNQLEWNENDEVLYPFTVESQEIKDAILDSLPLHAQANIKNESFSLDTKQRPIFKGEPLFKN